MHVEVVDLRHWLIVHEQDGSFLIGVNNDGEKVQAGRVIMSPHMPHSQDEVITEQGRFRLL